MGSILGHLRLRVQPWIQRSRVCMVGSWPLLAIETGMSYDVAGNLLNDGASTYSCASGTNGNRPRCLASHW